MSEYIHNTQNRFDEKVVETLEQMRMPDIEPNLYHLPTSFTPMSKQDSCQSMNIHQKHSSATAAVSRKGTPPTSEVDMLIPLISMLVSFADNISYKRMCWRKRLRRWEGVKEIVSKEQFLLASKFNVTGSP